MTTLNLVSLFAILSLIPTSFPYSFNNNEIRDLVSTDENFYTEAAAWEATSKRTTSLVTTCGTDNYILGGFGVLGSTISPYQKGDYYYRTYTNLPTHNIIYYSVIIWVIDSWDYSLADNYFDHFSLGFDLTVIPGPNINYLASSSPLCGGAWNDLGPVTVTGSVLHDKSSLNFQVISYLDQESEDESLGFRDINLIFVKENSPTVTALCTASSIGTEKACSCPIGKTNPPSCTTSCVAGCNSCAQTSPYKCFECASGYSWDGSQRIKCHDYCNGCFGVLDNTKCVTCQTNRYAYKTTTCLDFCPSFFKSDQSTAYWTCSLPCPPGQFYYPADGSCSLTCDLPLQMTSEKASSPLTDIVWKCSSPCSSGQFLYWDGTCQPNCNPPLNTRSGISNTMNFCDFPCTDPAFPILKWDRTCINVCEFPLSYENEYGKQFCRYPCVANQFLYNNGSCLSTCQDYFTQITYPAGYTLPDPKNGCNYKCTSTQALYSNGSCLPFPLPLLCQLHFRSYMVANDHHCAFPRGINEFMYNNGSCSPTCDWRFTSTSVTPSSTPVENFCTFKCGFSEYLYLNGSCITSCRPNYRAWFDKISGDKYCDKPCASGDYLLNNGTCSPVCPDFFIKFTEGTNGTDKYCNYPCQSNNYFYKNGTCRNDCPPHFIRRTYGKDKFCDYSCASAEYLYYNGSCIEKCDPPFVAVTSGSDNFCYFPCKVGDYRYDNGTCLSYCDPRFSLISNGNYHFCNYPCSSTQHLYNNGTCLPSCSSPMTQRSISGNNFCTYPCLSNHYLYDNGSCLSSCNPLFTQTTSLELSEKYCHFPCANVTEFIYWNGTCQSSCDLPYSQRVEGVYKFCVIKCSHEDYLYWNGTCQKDCKFPLQILQTKDVNYCNYPCSASKYLYWNGSCLDGCPSPLRTKKQAAETLCILPCDSLEDYYHNDTNECKPECNMMTVVQDNLYRKCVPFPVEEGKIIKFLSTPSSEPGTMSFTAIPKAVKYLKYLNISFSPRMRRVSNAQGLNPISNQYIISLIPKSTFQPNHRVLSLMFRSQDHITSFLINFWQELIMLCILLLIGILLLFAERLCFKIGWIYWRSFFERIRILFIWNLIVMSLVSSIDEMMLYSILEFKTLAFDSVLAVISFLACITMMILSVFIVILAGILGSRTLLLRTDSAKTKSYSAYQAFLTKWQKFQVLYRGFNNNRLSNSLFYPIYVIRIALSMAIAANLYQFPLIQTIFCVLISLGITVYILLMKPIKKKINQIQLVIVEFIVLIINCSALSLAILDAIDSNNPNTIIVIGDIIIVCGFAMNIIPLVFLVLKVCLTIKTARKYKDSPEISNAFMLQLLFLPFQQACFGFEQVQMTPFIPQSTEDVSLVRNKGKMDDFKAQTIDAESVEIPQWKISQDTERIGFNEGSPQTFRSQGIVTNYMSHLHDVHYVSNLRSTRQDGSNSFSVMESETSGTEGLLKINKMYKRNRLS